MAPVTFVHIGDAHMSPNARNVDRWKALDQIIDENIDRADLAAWLIPGDLNHARMTIEDRNAWAARLRRMGDKAPVVICYGNHDLPGDLDVFGRLKTEWPIFVVAKPEMVRLLIPHGPGVPTNQCVTVFVLPYPTEAGLVGAGVAPGDIIPAARTALEAILLDAGLQLEAARKNGDVVLAIGHVNVAGSITSVGQPNIGHEIEIDAPLIARLGQCYVGLNHIHKMQRIGGAYYPGSICRLDWGEIEPKSYFRIHYGAHVSMGATEADGLLYAVEICKLDVPAMFHVEGWLSRDGFTYEVKKGPEGELLEKPTSWRGTEVRARVRFHQSEKSVIEMAKAHVFAEFAECARFEMEPVCVPDGAVRAPEVAAALTLADKVEAWGREAHVPIPPALLELLPALEHGDADALIVVERRVIGELVDPTPAREERQAVA